MANFPEATILDIDLTHLKYSVKKLDGSIYKKYPGGSALGMYLLLKEMEAKVDALSPDNLLVFSVSPLTGLPISGQSRMVVTSKSPLTGTAGDSQAGGFMPAHIKANGYDAIVFRGKAEKPVYLYIDADKVEFKDAKRVWGKITGDAEEVIKEELEEKRIEIAQIGPGGENLVKYACILNERSRANGRLGMGAVMGSKNLKALVVKKQRAIKPMDMDGFKKLTKNVKERMSHNPGISGLYENGTDGLLEPHNNIGFLPTNNWQSGYFSEDKAKKITGTTMKETILINRDTCYACAIRCKRVVEVKGKVDPKYGGPEYETVGTFGSYCGIDHLEDIALANQLCNMYGLDTISCGATIAFAMECYEKGLISEKDTDGLELKFGNSSVLKELIPMIARREGKIGDLLAEGSKRAAEKIGSHAEEYVMACKGNELPAHMPQFKQSLALIYSLNPYGADHQSSEHDTALMAPLDSQEWQWSTKIGDFEPVHDYKGLDKNKTKYAYESQKFFSMLDSLSLCQFAWGPAWQLYGPDELVDLCKYGIGWDTSIEELKEIGERRMNMMRYFAAREGFTKKEDILPKRLHQPLPDGPSKGACVDKKEFEAAKQYYYELAGWDKDTGNPTFETLKKLHLEWVL